MSTLQGPTFCHIGSHNRDMRLHDPRVLNCATKTRIIQPIFRGSRGYQRATFPFSQSFTRKNSAICCSFSSSSDGSGSTAGNFHDNDEEYVNSEVIEAVEVRSDADGLSIKMRGGQYLRCTSNSPQSFPECPSQRAIVLKMEDGSDLLLAIIVSEMPSVMLMDAISNIPIARPTIYQVMEEMIDEMGYKAELVRITRRVREAYFARLFLTKSGDEVKKISFDLRPSDAINIAIRCKVPIQVHRQLVFTDGIRVLEQTKPYPHPYSDGLLFTGLDQPDGQACSTTKEFDLVRNMMIAIVEERYRDAAQWRDKLHQHRSEEKNWA